MVKVGCCSVPGLELHFRNPDHDPPHLHVRKKGEWEIKVDIRLTTAKELVWEPKWPGSFKGPTGSVRKQLQETVSENRQQLLVEWENKICQL